MSSAFQLACGVQSYEWGKIGSASKAAQFGTSSPGFEVDESKPYAELWMGTHPSCPSTRLTTGESLQELIAAEPDRLLGRAVVEKFGPDLPFLFKVLAIGKALSIQAHPDKTLAQRLHKERPDVYKDGNHKPEMALAITPFSGFCGFRPVPEIAAFLNAVPEFAALISDQAHTALVALSSETPLPSEAEPRKIALREVFECLMTAPDADVKTQLAALVKRYRVGGVELHARERELADLVLTLEGQFPGDVGAFCAFLLNVVSLEPGEGVFLRANEPHAYISGDIIECMATSDNVVRAGLTPKLRDVPTLVSMLTYTTASPSAQLMAPTAFCGLAHTLLYDPPIDEFSVLATTLASGGAETHPEIDGPSVVIVTEGAGSLAVGGGKAADKEALKAGSVWFVAAGEQVAFEAGQDGLVLYRAFVEA